LRTTSGIFAAVVPADEVENAEVVLAREDDGADFVDERLAAAVVVTPADDGTWVSLPATVPCPRGCRNAKIATTSTTTPRAAMAAPAARSRRRRRANWRANRLSGAFS
jgi:hypothetical protein